MAKRGSSKPGGKKMPTRITGKQRVARIRNIAIARRAKKKAGKGFLVPKGLGMNKY